MNHTDNIKVADAKIEDLLNRIVENRFKDCNLQLELCDNLLQLAERNADNTVIGETLYYKAEAEYILYSDTGDALPACVEDDLNRSIGILDASYAKQTLARAYNLSGIISNSKDNISNALESYLKCYSVCEANDLYPTMGLCACNIAVIFQFLGTYDDALHFLMNAIDCFNKSGDATARKETIAMIYTNIFSCYIKKKDYDNAHIYLDKILDNTQFIEPSFLVDFYQAQYLYYSAGTDDYKPYFDRALDAALQEENNIEFLDCYELLCEFLDDLHMDDKLLELLDNLERQLDPTSFPLTQINFVKYRLKILETSDNLEEYKKYSRRFVQMHEEIKKGYKTSILDSVNLKFYVEKLKLSESEFEQKSVTDNLTGIYNREGFTRYAKELLAKAKEQGKSISFSIFDVDDFKQINDSQGHLSGDETLKQIGDVLSGMKDENFIPGRFGGDEFVFVTYDKSADEVEKYAKLIAKSVTICTLSHGICYAVPSKTDEIADYTGKADENLYYVKNHGKNSYRITDKLGEKVTM